MESPKPQLYQLSVLRFLGSRYGYHIPLDFM
jgi:hypothetical protein